MRILAIANLPPFVIGGAEHQAAQMIQVWAGVGHTVDVAGHRIPDGVMTVGAITLRLHRLRVFHPLGRAGRAVSYFISISRLLMKRQQDFDIIYCRGFADAALAISALKWMRIVRLPVVICVTGSGFTGPRRFLRTLPAWRWILWLVDRHCDAMNSISPSIDRELLDIGFRQPVRSRIRNGVKIRVPIPSRSSRARNLVCVSRLSAEKGVDVLLAALALLKLEKRDLICKIVGDGPEHRVLKVACTALGLDNIVVFLGEKGPSEIRPILAESDLFVLPSRGEGMSNAALEAMEAGLPIVLTRCGGIDTYVNESIGWVCEPDDPSSLANALRLALDADPEDMAARGGMARKLVEEHFDLDVISARNLELFEQVVRARAA